MRLDTERQAKLEPTRITHAVQEIEKLGIEVVAKNDTNINFVFKGSYVVFFPYSGWHSGKTIKDGRGLDNLLKQLKK